MNEMKILKTISGRIIKINTNYSKRTFTIKTKSAKYRTYPMSKEEFQSCEHNTGNDWQQFLRSNDYYKVN
jgi:arsenate reductase-like glutaredoxin family protein